MNGAAGGAAMSVLALMDAMRPLGVESSAVCLDAGSPDERAALRAATRGQVRFTPLYVWNRKIRAAAWKRPLLELRQLARTRLGLGSFANVARFAREQRVDLVHTSTILTPEGALASRLLGLPHVWHVREVLGRGAPFRLPVEGKPLGRLLARLAARVVANSSTTAQRLRDWLPAGLLEVVPNGIALAPFAAVPDLVARPAVVIGMVGSLSSRVKKHALFVEAAAVMSHQGDTEIRIYGHDPDDTYARDLKALAQRLGLASRLRWMGFAPPERIMSEIDVLCHPADGESFGRIAVEAMAAGRPVVGTRAGGVGELVSDGVTGLLAPPDDAAALAAHLDRLVESPELRAQMGRRGRTEAARYSIEACARGIAAVYEEALRSPPR
jgi:glycosyltransferase involved in cell wall biosynthesis